MQSVTSQAVLSQLQAAAALHGAAAAGGLSAAQFVGGGGSGGGGAGGSADVFGAWGRAAAAGVPNAASGAAILQQLMGGAGVAGGAAAQQQQQQQQQQQRMANSTAATAAVQQLDEEKVYTLVADLLEPATREAALLELSKKREQFEDLPLILWHSFGERRPRFLFVCFFFGIALRRAADHGKNGGERPGSRNAGNSRFYNVFLHTKNAPGVMSTLLQEIVSVYPLLSPPTLTAQASNRVCNALALLQCVASHVETRGLFLNAGEEVSDNVPADYAARSRMFKAHIPLFLYPFLSSTSKIRPFEYLRLTSLGVIGALVKVRNGGRINPADLFFSAEQNDSSEVVNFLLSTEIIPLCLRIMETGSELSKTVAIFIVQKMLMDDSGLAYICQTYERFYAVGTILSNMVSQLVEVS
ncbi:MAG: cell differentiation family, Rcd1-like-domain-containing protein [Olpidium bornovanus]|uniref:Cell differentiation family, Rcd1-like-domain-containing protein n=1 Tax=Olpidium bornovanus TaxID=278681 RepID=A0A8H7ZUC2_9FUNG|nr:MAG: cell differentiation family, Rcd1-like-domain-containing protein [Olpidium bornovanus]